jgi:hypothetical protein
MAEHLHRAAARTLLAGKPVFVLLTHNDSFVAGFAHHAALEALGVVRLRLRAFAPHATPPIFLKVGAL